MASKIEDYAIIGDGRTCALVERQGAIEWLCVPRFDSDACFASLLGRQEHGQWMLRPLSPIKSVSRCYRNHTLILETEITCEAGVVRIVDFMPHGSRRPIVVRLLEGVEGDVEMFFELAPRFGYWRQRPDGVLWDGEARTRAADRTRTPALTEVHR